MKSSAELRQAFLDYFGKRGHEIVASSSLVPANDPTLLFVNAGMVQFKEVFLGQEKRSYVRATTSQRCVRAGGKHNDLENVGHTARHHTFFEMLGNFSFGDYFKKEAIAYAWEFLTDLLEIPPEKLWVTVFEEDDEAADIWLNDIGVDPERFARIGAKDNFWSMGETGPCGPCTEIFYDHGPEIPGGPPGTPEEEGDRFVEIWNLVFMQYDRDQDGNLKPLPRPSVDTGMGLERLAAVMQGVHSNYEIDLFRNLIAKAAEVTATVDLENNSLKVIADHIRACAFLVVDGVLPSNEGRGYVLRRIIRRAIRHGYQLGVREPFFSKLVGPLCDEMGAAYPELTENRVHVERILLLEEQRFAETLEQGMRILEDSLSALEGNTIPGETVFKLYDTYGFPVDLTADFARERGLVLDMQGFEREMGAQRSRARAASQFEADYSGGLDVEGSTGFTGYERLVDSATVTDLFREGTPVTQLNAGESGVVVLDHTPFYAESGGQVGDRGILESSSGCFVVQDTQKQGGETFIHIGRIEKGSLVCGERIEARVDAERRQATVLNHSGTHLLHAALRAVLGDHVQQKGSLVDPERLRFDFAHYEPVTREQLDTIESLVNRQIRTNADARTSVMSMEDALEAGAIALFGEKYGDEVRVLSIGDFSVELCGGTHVRHAGDIGLLKIIAETGIAAGVRRIEAVTGERAQEWVSANELRLQRISELVKGSPDDAEDKVIQLIEKNRKLEKELQQLKGRLASSQGSDLAAQAIEVGGIKVLAARLEGADNRTLRETMDQLKNKLGSAAVVLGTVTDNKVSIIAGVTKDQTDRLKAGELVNVVASQVGGKGGGRPDMAQAGGNQPENLDAALDSVSGWVQERLSA
ncbi:MAG: alanine--tRNA ligase [Gammaproteobacteria bacterium]|nr:MAG: alanine--tRNA ligase [Gammaproteobacteria bacterium]